MSLSAQQWAARELIARSRINTVIEEMVEWRFHAPQHSAATRCFDYAELTWIPMLRQGPLTKGSERLPPPFPR